MLPELHQTCHAEHVEVKADPGEGEDHPQAAQHQAVQSDYPAQGGEAGAVELQGEHVSLHTGGSVVTLTTPLITDNNNVGMMSISYDFYFISLKPSFQIHFN